MEAPGNGGRIGQRLLDLREDIEEARDERAELQGELKSVTNQLEDEFGVSTVDEAVDQLDEMEKELVGMRESLNQQVAKIEEMMDRNG